MPSSCPYAFFLHGAGPLGRPFYFMWPLVWATTDEDV